MQHLSRVSFSCRDRTLASGVYEQSFVGELRHCRAWLIRDREGVGAGGTRAFQHHIDIGTLARLRDADYERPFEVETRVVDRVNRRSGKRDWNARSYLEQVAAKERSVVRAAAGDNDDQIDVLLPEKRPELFILFALAGERAFEHGRLFGDLIEHQRHKLGI